MLLPRRVRPLAGVLLVLAATACGGGGAPTERFELTGRVVEDLTGDGVDDVTVTFTSDTRRTAMTTTGSDGVYRMAVDTDVAFGQVRAEKDGWLPDERTVYFDSPERRIDLRIRPAPMEP